MQYALGAFGAANAALTASSSFLAPLIINDVVQAYASTIAATTTSITLNLPASTLGIYPGMVVVGPNINGSYAASTTGGANCGALVTAVSGNVITLGQATTNASIVSTRTPLTFYDPASPANTSPMVLPAGAIVFQYFADVLSAFNGTSPSVTIQMVSPNNAAYATAAPYETVANMGAINATGRTLASVSLFATSPQAAQLYGVGGGLNPSDAIVNVRVGLGSGTATTGLGNFGVIYAVCNPDGTMGPETPGYGSAIY
jgi:hypothetical protein